MSQSKKFFAAIIIACGLSVFFTFEFCKNKFKKELATKTAEAIQQPSGEQCLGYNVHRLSGYQYVKPLLYIEKKEESSNLTHLRNSISEVVEKYKKSGVLMSASVYLRVFSKGNWMCINDTEMYLPGSLIKVAGLLTYLKMEEEHPGVLNRRLAFESPKEFIPNQTYNSKQIELGKSYTIRELLKYMIAYSDNNATYLLNKNVDQKAFLSLFSDLGISLDGVANGSIKLNVKDYSVFLRVLYNATFVNIEHSEFAAEMLAQCDFKEGMEKGLPMNTKIAHKFGEMGDATTRQLHESGIIYNKNAPFLLTVMTKGYDITKLPEVISAITKLTYDDVSTNPEFTENSNEVTSGSGSSQTHTK